jgi:hypothetical protein
MRIKFRTEYNTYTCDVEDLKIQCNTTWTLIKVSQRGNLSLSPEMTSVETGKRFTEIEKIVIRQERAIQTLIILLLIGALIWFTTA